MAEASEPRSDQELLAAHVAGDPEAFGELFARHRDRLWAVALRTMGNPEDAADGLQDGLMAAYRRAGSFRGEAQVTTWLHRVVVNACLDRIRAAKVRRAEALPDDLDEHAGRGALATATGDVVDPADTSVRAEQRRAGARRPADAAGGAARRPRARRHGGLPGRRGRRDPRLRRRHREVALLAGPGPARRAAAAPPRRPPTTPRPRRPPGTRPGPAASHHRARPAARPSAADARHPPPTPPPMSREP